MKYLTFDSFFQEVKESSDRTEKKLEEIKDVLEEIKDEMKTITS